MIKSGGENIYSPEVESAICSHPEVFEAVVIGVPDEKWGEAIKALVVRRPGCALTEAALVEFCRARLTHFKRPHSVDFVNELPKGGTGKVQNNVLCERYREPGGQACNESRQEGRAMSLTDYFAGYKKIPKATESI